jgi:hypothetical protein
LYEEQPLIIGIRDVELNLGECQLFSEFDELIGGGGRRVNECVDKAAVYLFKEYLELACSLVKLV